MRLVSLLVVALSGPAVGAALNQPYAEKNDDRIQPGECFHIYRLDEPRVPSDQQQRVIKRVPRARNKEAGRSVYLLPLKVNNPYAYKDPLVAKRVITSGYGPRHRPNPKASADHRAWDLPAHVGTEVVAVTSGTIRDRGDRGTCGNLLYLVSDDGTKFTFCHLSSYASTMKPGARVMRGDVIALSGGKKGAQGSGSSDGPHLHIQIESKDGKMLNPENLAWDFMVHGDPSTIHASSRR